MLSIKLSFAKNRTIITRCKYRYIEIFDWKISKKLDQLQVFQVDKKITVLVYIMLWNQIREVNSLKARKHTFHWQRDTNNWTHITTCWTLELERTNPCIAYYYCTKSSQPCHTHFGNCASYIDMFSGFCFNPILVDIFV